jgi:hypothetical protein
MPLIILGSIIFPITLIWLFKHCQDYFWWCGLKVCCIVCTFILPTHLKKHLEFTKILKLMATRGTRNFEMWKQGGFQCWAMLRELWQNTKLHLWRWPWITLQPTSYVDLWTFLWPPYFAWSYLHLHLLKSMHTLIKFAQSKYVFVCDLVATIKVCQCDVYSMYDYQTFRFTIDNF